MIVGLRLRLTHKLRTAKQRAWSKLLDFLSPDLLFYIISHERSGSRFVMNTILRNTYIKQNWHNIGEWFGPYDNPANRFAHIDAFNSMWDLARKQGSIIMIGSCLKPDIGMLR